MSVLMLLLTACALPSEVVYVTRTITVGPDTADTADEVLDSADATSDTGLLSTADTGYTCSQGIGALVLNGDTNVGASQPGWGVVGEFTGIGELCRVECNVWWAIPVFSPTNGCGNTPTPLPITLELGDEVDFCIDFYDPGGPGATTGNCLLLTSDGQMVIDLSTNVP